jgi:hypothetical protein
MKLISVVLLVSMISACGDGLVLVQRPKDGVDGKNGHNAAFDVAVPLVGVCSNGGSILNAGTDLDDNLILDLSEVTVSIITCNGTNGVNGTNGIDGVSPAMPALMPVAILNPCGDAPSIYDEVFLKLADGTVLASYSDNTSGMNTRFTKLIAGTYGTTDGDNCVFTIDASGNITSQNKNY